MAKIKVLLIDDDKDFLKIMSLHIRAWGYDLSTASNGKDGIDAAKLEKPRKIHAVDVFLDTKEDISLAPKIN